MSNYFPYTATDISPGHETKDGQKIPAELSAETVTLAQEHFWCDFSDLFPGLNWDRNKTCN